MRVLLISDIHANEVALEAVIKDADSFDQVWCLGDIIGYGPRPNEVCQRLIDLNSVVVGGNHDYSAVGRLDPFHMHQDAFECIIRHSLDINANAALGLVNAPEYQRVNLWGESTGLLVHGSPIADPMHCLGYINGEGSAVDAACAIRDGDDHVRASHLFYGHTHVPALWRASLAQYEAGNVLGDGAKHAVLLEEGGDAVLINPGSVGQPRDGDSRASYMIVTLAPSALLVEHRRVAYDVDSVIDQMLSEGYPALMATRLSHGR